MVSALNPLQRAVMFVCAASLVGGLALAPVRAAEPATPGAYVSDFLNASSDVFVNGSKSGEARAKKLKTLFQARMDVPLIATFMAGANVQQASPADRDHFQDLLAGYLVEVFYSKIRNFASAPFDVGPPKIIGNGIIAVPTLVREAGSAPQTIVWRLEKVAGTYRIVDVVVDGISVMVIEKAGFSSALQEGGLPKLIMLLEQHAKTSSVPA